MELTRTDVLAYRARVHNLEKRVPSPADCASLDAGIRDGPPGRTARMALAARLGTTAASGIPGLADGGELAYAYTLRGAMHVHRAADLPVLAGAIVPREPGDVTDASFGPLTPDIPVPEAVERVADAMREVMADGVARTKGELSGAVTPRVDERLCPWCAGCGAHHPQDALFRYATLRAGLVVTAAGTFTGGGFTPADPDGSRRELVHRFLRLCGPAGHQRLAAWLAVQPATARRLLHLVDDLVDDLVEVSVDGRKAWTRPGILDEIRDVPDARTVRFLPPHDPLTEVADRELLVPDPAVRREVWRATVSPGALLVRGEIAGTVRLKVCSDKITATVRTFGRLEPATQAAGEKEARRLAGLLGRSGSDTWYEPP